VSVASSRVIVPVATFSPRCPASAVPGIALGIILAAGRRTGTLRDVPSDDVTAMLLGVSLSLGGDATPERTGRLLDLVVDALRPRSDR
jgi:hypothetical protein